jgi:hypothetical protein
MKSLNLESNESFENGHRDRDISNSALSLYTYKLL